MCSGHFCCHTASGLAPTLTIIHSLLAQAIRLIISSTGKPFHRRHLGLRPGRVSCSHILARDLMQYLIRYLISQLSFTDGLALSHQSPQSFQAHWQNWQGLPCIHWSM
ncbi:hypothetical protein B0J12DRAFT_95800 [Macrophomina phaseolina]|uniref:Uncharacterized protein n=1 Tax=Macrophomina phaseolina TaxID=35725 RepID=A0ABQ8G989_9PEZI|nr:hypothetical protein B0J12DRAFT_95800 [Macrophomina phaseolina]